MIFQQIVNEDAGCITYLIGCGQAGEALVVDPGRDRVDDYLAWARRKGLSLTRIVDTHIHADHLSGNQALEGKPAPASTSIQQQRRLFLMRPSPTGTRSGSARCASRSSTRRATRPTASASS